MKSKNILLSQFPVFGIYFLYSWNKIGKWSPREFLYEIDLSALQSEIGFKLVLEVTLDHPPIPEQHTKNTNISIIIIIQFISAQKSGCEDNKFIVFEALQVWLQKDKTKHDLTI